MALKLGGNQIPLLFVGEMGIKRGYAGNERIYERGGGYFYLEFFSASELFVPQGATALITKDGSTFYVK